MNKFIYKKDQNYTDHWEFCNQNKYPFITINNIDNGFSELFFDITNISNKLEDLCKTSNLYDIFWYVKNNVKNNTITVPSKLIDKFSNSGEDLKIVEYIVKCYDEKVELSILDYIKLLDITVLNFEIRKTTINIEKLRQMDQSNEAVISNLNFNVEKLMELNRNLKNIEKGVHHE